MNDRRMRPIREDDPDIYDFTLPNDAGYRPRKGSGKKKKGSVIGNVITGIIMVVALGVFCYAGYNLFTIYSDYHGASKEYAQLVEYVTLDEATEQVVAIDFDALRAINPDIVGWIRFEEPEIINYPVMYRESDNEYYLTHTFDGSSYGSGALFINKDNAPDITDSNTFIYGHNMKNKSMFGSLPEYLKEEFYKEHPYFWFYTADGTAYKYQVFSMYETVDDSDSYEMFYDGPEDFEAYLNKVRSRSNYFVTPEAELNGDAKILTLSTCTNRFANGRYLLHGIRLGEVETIQVTGDEN